MSKERTARLSKKIKMKAGKPARFETMLLNTVNGALKRARDTVQQEMMKQMQAGGGLGGLFGK